MWSKMLAKNPSTVHVEAIAFLLELAAWRQTTLPNCLFAGRPLVSGRNRLVDPKTRKATRNAQDSQSQNVSKLADIEDWQRLSLELSIPDRG